jgi:hypothetical protein
VPCSGRPVAGDPCSGRRSPERRRAPARHGRAPARSSQAGQAGAVGLPCAGELRPSGRAGSARARWPPLRRSASPALESASPASSGQARRVGAVGLHCAGELRPSGTGGKCAGVGELRRCAGGRGRPSCASVGLPYVGIPCYGEGRGWN